MKICLQERYFFCLRHNLGLYIASILEVFINIYMRRFYIYFLYFIHIFFLHSSNNFNFSILIPSILGLKRNRVHYSIYRTEYLFVTLLIREQ